MDQLPVTPVDVSIVSADKGYVLQNSDASALYWYTLDARGRSNCNDTCAATWPPLVPSKDAKPLGDWTIIKREDSSRQWTFRGKPVYTYAKDRPGAADGDGMGGVWRLFHF